MKDIYQDLIQLYADNEKVYRAKEYPKRRIKNPYTCINNDCYNATHDSDAICESCVFEDIQKTKDAQY